MIFGAGFLFRHWRRQLNTSLQKQYSTGCMILDSVSVREFIGQVVLWAHPETPQVFTFDPWLSARNGQMEHNALADFLKNKSHELRSLDARTPWGCAKRCYAMLRPSLHMANQLPALSSWSSPASVIEIHTSINLHQYPCWKLIWHDPHQDNWRGHDSMLCKRNKLGLWSRICRSQIFRHLQFRESSCLAVAILLVFQWHGRATPHKAPLVVSWHRIHRMCVKPRFDAHYFATSSTWHTACLQWNILRWGRLVALAATGRVGSCRISADWDTWLCQSTNSWNP